MSMNCGSNHVPTGAGNRVGAGGGYERTGSCNENKVHGAHPDACCINTTAVGIAAALCEGRSREEISEYIRLLNMVTAAMRSYL